jgi:hypothetical protein
MDPPIFIWERGDLIVFDTPSRATDYLEWQDVEDGVYEAYDSGGRRLLLGVDRQSRKERWRRSVSRTVTIGEAEEEPLHGERLAEILKRALAAIGEKPVSDDLPALVMAAHAAFANQDS